MFPKSFAIGLGTRPGKRPPAGGTAAPCGGDDLRLVPCGWAGGSRSGALGGGLDGEPDQVLVVGEAAQPGGERLDGDAAAPFEQGLVCLVEDLAQDGDVAAPALVGHSGRQVDSP